MEKLQNVKYKLNYAQQIIALYLLLFQKWINLHNNRVEGVPTKFTARQSRRGALSCGKAFNSYTKIGGVKMARDVSASYSVKFELRLRTTYFKTKNKSTNRKT